MAAPVLLMARALPALKSGYAMVSRWRKLDPSRRAAVQAEGRAAIAALAGVKAALSIQRQDEIASDWKQALDSAMHPGHAEKLARSIVERLQEESEATTDEIATAVGAAGSEDSAFNEALELARDDGYIRRSGITLRGIKWDVTEWADRELLETDHVCGIEEQITAFVERYGLVSLDHISSALALDNDAPELQAALERAVASTRVTWYCRSIYGLARTELAAFEPPEDIWAETYPGDGDEAMGTAVEELKLAVGNLGRAIAAQDGVANSDGAKSPDLQESDLRPDDAPAKLKQLKDLHEAGLITDEEYTTKRAAVLEQL